MSLSRKKKWLCGSIGGVILLSVVYMSLPYYARQALVHWMPVIDDLETFHRNVVRHNPDDVWHWERAEGYNRYRLFRLIRLIWIVCIPFLSWLSGTIVFCSKVIGTGGTIR